MDEDLQRIRDLLVETAAMMGANSIILLALAKASPWQAQVIANVEQSIAEIGAKQAMSGSEPDQYSERLRDHCAGFLRSLRP